MKNQMKIFLYNFFTVVFALMTFVSIGALAQGASVLQVVSNAMVFSSLTYYCYNEENRLRNCVKKSACRRKAQLRVLKAGPHKAA